MPDLVLGPVLRYVDDTRATVWVQTDAACEVEVLGRRAPTFDVQGHHFALVVLDGLEPGSQTPYEVALDGRTAWPPAEHPFPPSLIRTAGGRGGLRLVFGSCREVAPHEPPYALPKSADPRAHGLDALRTYALALAREPAGAWPDALLMLGDQLYADEPPRYLSGALRRDAERPAGDTRAASLADYAVLYRESWREPAVRWLLSTVPSMMILDDHEIVDEWKISQAWIAQQSDRPGFADRVTAGLMAYWLFQHIGNLSPEELAGDDVYGRVRGPGGAAALRAFAADADRQVGHSHWSYSRDLGRVRLLVLDSRASRRLQPGDRRIVDDHEWSWAVERASDLTGIDHLVMASSVPFLLPPGLHDLEAALERVADGAWGGLAARGAEWLRRTFNLGHWASFQASFAQLAALLEEVAARRDGADPASVVLLSGDVHHGYLARWRPRSPSGAAAPVWQVVCSPFRKRLPRHERAVMRFGESGLVRRLSGVLARATRAPVTRAAWRLCLEPSYRNQIGVLEIDGRRARARLEAVDGDWRAPRLRTLWDRPLA